MKIEPKHETQLELQREDEPKLEVERDHETKLESIEIDLSLPLQFIPKNHTRGDRDFAGNGPKVDVWAAITIENRNEIHATLSMFAEETRPD